ncbi:DUF1376 domain-containing protein [Hymenobacter baengnokdamensis]|uniref:DUF1376 domain-containing protein n=1 Tax=Hymenobacter baengnokdamensis TaxID=2615203 RepID=UPI0012465DD3|nr:DUF1376 domain-containing protein [Hymenobacter baengnokdamensis]
MKAPAFLLYTGDFLSSPDVQLMEAHEVGAYCLLLFNSWQSDRPGFLPNDEDRLRRTARLSADQWATSRKLLLSKFPVNPQDDTLRYNPRLRAEAAKQLEYRELKSRAGKASAQKRAANATGVEQQATPVQQLLTESTTPLAPITPLLTAVENELTPVVPKANTRSQKGQQKSNLSSSLSTTSSLRSEGEAAEAALPTPIAKKKSSGSPLLGRGAGGEVPRRPTPEEVRAYAASQYPTSLDAPAEATAFFDYFASNGWRVGGKTPMIDWQAAFRGWMRRRPQFLAAPGSPAAAPPTRARTAPKPTDPTRWS